MEIESLKCIFKIGLSYSYLSYVLLITKSIDNLFPITTKEQMA